MYVYVKESYFTISAQNKINETNAECISHSILLNKYLYVKNNKFWKHLIFNQTDECEGGVKGRGHDFSLHWLWLLALDAFSAAREHAVHQIERALILIK